MKKMWKALFAVSCAVLLTACGQSVEHKSTSDGGAGSETDSAKGSLVIYSPLTQAMIDSMTSKFEQETGIHVEALAMGTGDALKRIETEAGKPQADILWSGTIGTVKNKSHLFADYKTPNESAFFDEYKNKEGNLTRFDTIPSVIMVNKNLVGDIKIEGYEDLLNPKLKGKIAFADPAASSSSFEHLVNMLYAMGKGDPTKGWDYVQKFIAQLDGKLLGGSSAVYKGVADGEYTVGLTFEQGAAQYVGAGAPVDVVYMKEGVIFRGDGVYIIKDAPHMESAQKFVDWLTTKETQTFMNNTQFRRTIRNDVPATDAMKAMKDINVIQDDESVTASKKSEWVDQFKNLFTK